MSSIGELTGQPQNSYQSLGHNQSADQWHHSIMQGAAFMAQVPPQVRPRVLSSFQKCELDVLAKAYHEGSVAQPKIGIANAVVAIALAALGLGFYDNTVILAIGLGLGGCFGIKAYTHRLDYKDYQESLALVLEELDRRPPEHSEVR